MLTKNSIGSMNPQVIDFFVGTLVQDLLHAVTFIKHYMPFQVDPFSVTLGPPINFILSRWDGGGGVKNCQFYLVKRRLRGREGVKNC